MKIIQPIFCYKYSRPLEESLSSLEGKILNKNHHTLMERKAQYLQKLWNPYEKKVIKYFEEIYKIKIINKKETFWLTKILPSSVSMPLIISIKDCWNIETDDDYKISILLNILHELAHFFSYTHSDAYINKVFSKLSGKNRDSHYLIQAVEFGIGTELFGEKIIKERMEYLASDKSFAYANSIRLLIADKISPNKNSLEEIVNFFNIS